MSRSAAIIGAGQIAREAAFSLAFQNFSRVRVLARTRPSWMSPDDEEGTEGDGIHFERYVVGDDPAPSADVVLDTIAFDEADTARYEPDRVGRLIVISSASVYADNQGRTLDEAQQNGWPEFAEPISENQPTVPPGPATYSTRKVRMEHMALQKFGDRATILRPGAIHGKYSRHPREWWFVKRMIDRRAKIPLIFNAQSQFQTSSTTDLTYFAARCADKDVGGIFNVGDSDHLSVIQIGEIIARSFDYEPEFIPIEGAGMIGRTPWSVGKPFLISSAKIGSTLGYRMDGFHYGGEAPRAVEWLAELNPPDWRAAFPQLAAYPWDLFDYEAEDRFLASL